MDAKIDGEPVRVSSPEPEKTALAAPADLETCCDPPERVAVLETAVQAESVNEELSESDDQAGGLHSGEAMPFAHPQAVDVCEPPASDDQEPTEQQPIERNAATEQDGGRIWESDPRLKGLLAFKKWWLLREVDISVNGKLLCGIPIFTCEGAMRVVSDKYSYIIPMHGVDYIRTPDGLQSIESEFEGSIHAK